MQSNTIQTKIRYYLEKYPNSKITLTYGQRGTIQDDIKEFGKSKKYIFVSKIEVALASKLVAIQQVQHSQDYNNDYDKTIDIIFLFREEQQGTIRDCNGDDCNNAVGEATVHGDVEFCGDCLEEMEKQESVNCKNCGGSYRCSQCC